MRLGGGAAHPISGRLVQVDLSKCRSVDGWSVDGWSEAGLAVCHVRWAHMKGLPDQTNTYMWLGLGLGLGWRVRVSSAPGSAHMRKSSSRWP